MLVSVIIPARHWDQRLVATLEAIAAQRLPVGVEVETIIGLADDPPVELPAGVTVVRNPSGTIPDALNLAIAASSGEVIARVDARCLIPADHVARVVEALSDPMIGSVGGAALVLDRGWFGSAYAVAFNSPMLGPSAYRYRRKSGSSSSPYVAAWRRETLDRTGGFDPEMLRNQDNELADRVADLDLTIWYDADLVVGYHNDRNWPSAMRHHYDFGWWRMAQRGRGQRGLGLRHLITVGAVTSVGVVALAGLRSRRTRKMVIAGLLGSYGFAVAGSYVTARRLRHARRDIELPAFDPLGVVCAPFVAATLDASWAAGLIAGSRASRKA